MIFNEMLLTIAVVPTRCIKSRLNLVQTMRLETCVSLLFTRQFDADGIPLLIAIFVYTSVHATEFINIAST